MCEMLLREGQKADGGTLIQRTTKSMQALQMQNDREEGTETEKTRCFDVEEDWQWRRLSSVGGVLTCEWGSARFNSMGKGTYRKPVWDAFLPAPPTGSPARCYVRKPVVPLNGDRGLDSRFSCTTGQTN